MTIAEKFGPVASAVIALSLVGCTSHEIGPSEACDTAMQAAAAVTQLNNDTELLATVEACQDPDDWVSGIQHNPGAGSLTSYTRDDAISLLQSICLQSPDSRVCAAGITSKK
jgi:hypothetical protein